MGITQGIIFMGLYVYILTTYVYVWGRKSTFYILKILHAIPILHLHKGIIEYGCGFLWENWWVGASSLKVVLMCYVHAKSGFWTSSNASEL